MNDLMEFLKIRYVKLHYTIQLLTEGQLPYNKASALRGGMGPWWVCGGLVGWLVGFRSNFFRKKRISQYLQAFYTLGMMGLGKDHLPFHIIRVTNTTGDTLVKEMDVFKEKFRVATIEEYVKYRLTSTEMRSYSDSASVYRLIFHSPLTLKYGGQMQKSFSPEAVLAAAERRLYILNCFEGRKENEGLCPGTCHRPYSYSSGSVRIWRECKAIFRHPPFKSHLFRNQRLV